MLQLSFAPLALVVTALSAQATATAPSAAESNAASAAADKRICRREVATGTIMAKRVCKTQAEWTAQTRQSQEALRQMRGTGSSGLGN